MQKEPDLNIQLSTEQRYRDPEVLVTFCETVLSSCLHFQHNLSTHMAALA
jgi:hypothetical protein